MRPTHQTATPIVHLSLQQTARSAESLVSMYDSGDLSWETTHAPYQRGAVWTRDQQIQLIASGLSGTPIPAIILNRRDWRHLAEDAPYYVVIDGQQRLRAFNAWYKGNLAVPASWWRPDMVESAQATDDGPYVTIHDLTTVGRRYFGNRVVLPIAEANVPTVQEEAEIYLRVNGYGTAQTSRDLANAAGIARHTA